MATAQAVYTSSQRAQAEVLLHRASKWARGVRPSDGLAFYLFTSSRTTADGQPMYHQTHVRGESCTCPSHTYRGACSHALAAQLLAERQERIADEADALLEEYAAQQAYKGYQAVLKLARMAGVCAERGCQDDSVKGDDFCRAHLLVDVA